MELHADLLLKIAALVLLYGVVIPGVIMPTLIDMVLTWGFKQPKVELGTLRLITTNGDKV